MVILRYCGRVLVLQAYCSVDDMVFFTVNGRVGDARFGAEEFMEVGKWSCFGWKDEIIEYKL